MSTADIKTFEWLEDYEIRSEYGSVTLKYDIAAAIVAARKMKNLTQAALANIAGVSQAYIAKLESGGANPTIGRVGAILASIWLKAEINLVPIVQSSDSKIAGKAENAEEARAMIPAKEPAETERWLQLQAQGTKHQFPSSSLSNKITSTSIVTVAATSIFYVQEKLRNIMAASGATNIVPAITVLDTFKVPSQPRIAAGGSSICITSSTIGEPYGRTDNLTTSGGIQTC